MIPIYAHEYIFTPIERAAMGLQQIMVLVITESTERQDFEVIHSVNKFWDQDLNITHKIVLEGYKNNV